MKLAILLLNFGCPDGDESVKPFLYNLFRDPAVLPLPFGIRHFVAWRIATKRAPYSAKNYQMIGGSPLLKIIREQGAGVERLLADLGEVKTFPAMGYWHPYIHEAMDEIAEWKSDKTIALPLFPHYCSATTGSVFTEVKKNAYKIANEIIYSNNYHAHPLYIQAVRAVIKSELENREAPTDTVILFSPHGVPQKIVDKGDPYVHQIQKSADMIASGFSHQRDMSFQSKVGKAQWYGENTLDKVRALARQGVKNLAVVPISFTSENIETLHELDIQVREVAEKAGIENYFRIPTVDTHPLFMECLADLVRSAVN